VLNIWSEVEKKFKIVDDHIQWSDIVSGINEAINLLYISLYPTSVQYGGTYFTTQEGDEFKRIRGDLAGSKIPLSEYKVLWLKHIESYLKVLTKIPHTWFTIPRLFHGPMSRDKSEKLLTNCKPLTLILRYTCKQQALCLSSRRTDGHIQHIELKLSDGNSLSIQWDKENRRRFTSIEAIIWQSPLVSFFFPEIPKAQILQKEQQKEKEK